MLKTNLAILMAERGLKISDVYEATGISKTTLMAISENTGKGIQYETVDKLCNFLGVTPSDFFSYAPYIFKFYKTNNENNLSDIVITVNHSNNLRSFKFSPYVTTPSSSDYPVIPNDANFMINYEFELSVNNPNRSTKDQNTFRKIYDQLPVNLKSDINNHFLSIVANDLSKLNNKEITVFDTLFENGNDNFNGHKIKIKNGMNVIVNLFDNKFTRVIKVPLLVVHDDKGKNK